MAFDVKKFGIRSLTAIAFVAVLLGSLLWSYVSFSIFFLVVAIWGLHEFFELGARLGYQTYRPAGFLSAVLLYFAFVHTDLLSPGIPALVPFSLLVIVSPLLLCYTVFDKSGHAVQNAFMTLGGLLYVVLPVALLHKLVITHSPVHTEYKPTLLLGIILLIWSNDTFAYLGGSFFGKNKMIERVSPGKTWEGTLTGVLVTFGLSFIMPGLMETGNAKFWMLCGVVVPVLATFGDLLESVLKRQAGVKDTGNIMPGHGGILDRFDSLIFVSPFAGVLAEVMC